MERSFAWAARFRRLARDYERLSATVAGLHFVALGVPDAQPSVLARSLTARLKTQLRQS